jgi:hypothetical protein
MKRLMYLSVLVVLLLYVDQIYTKTNLKTLKTKRDKAEKIYNNINALGHKVNTSKVLTKFPVTIKSCDEILIFPASFIADLNDYRKREEGFFSVSAYTINMYRDKDANQLINSIDFGNMKIKPSLLTGAKGCVLAKGVDANKDITICFSDKALTENLLQAVNTFHSCRRGDNLQPIPKELIKQLIQQCGNDGPLIDPTKKAFKMNTAPRAGNKWDSDRMSFYHPNGIHVPGTR